MSLHFRYIRWSVRFVDLCVICIDLVKNWVMLDGNNGNNGDNVDERNLLSVYSVGRVFSLNLSNLCSIVRYLVIIRAC